MRPVCWVVGDAIPRFAAFANGSIEGRHCEPAFEPIDGDICALVKESKAHRAEAGRLNKYKSYCESEKKLEHERPASNRFERKHLERK